MSYKLGAHQSIEGGYTKALNRIKNIGGNCLQIFSSSPRGWNFTTIDEVQATQFLEKRSELNIDRVYFHASYLINLAKRDKIGSLSKLSIISGRDRHENIGKGTIPLETFKLLLNHPKTRHLPFIIETPGFDQKGPDKMNLEILKSLIGK